VELIETYINLDKELEGFEVAFGILKNDEFYSFSLICIKSFRLFQIFDCFCFILLNF